MTKFIIIVYGYDLNIEKKNIIYYSKHFLTPRIFVDVINSIVIIILKYQNLLIKKKRELIRSKL
jgi:hypothetical protein